MDEEELAQDVIAYVSLANNHAASIQNMNNQINDLIDQYNHALQLFHGEALNPNPNLQVWRIQGQSCIKLRVKIQELEAKLHDAINNLDKIRNLHVSNVLSSHVQVVNSVAAAQFVLEMFQMYNWDGFVWIDEDLPINAHQQIHNVLAGVAGHLLN